MDFSETPKTPRWRLPALLALVLCVMAVYVGVMFQIQIVNGEDYKSKSVSQIVRSSTVEAARGNITDRSGNLIVGNRQTYTLTFDATLLPDGTDQNEAILRLVNLCIDNNVAYTDNVPLSQNAPFTYVTLTDSQQKLFDRYVSKTLQPWLEKQLKRRAKVLAAAKDNPEKTPEADSFLDDATLDPENLTAPQLMEAMRRQFEIDESVSDADARKIVAVRWELALRKEYATTAYVLANDVDINLITYVKDGDYYGADIGTAATRQYETTAAAHILGTVGAISPEEYEKKKDDGYSINAIIGKSGAESAFEEYLHGTDGVRYVNINDEGKVTSELYAVEPQPGATVELTLDLPFQEKVEQLLAENIGSMTKKDGVARGGAAVVVEIGTGDVLALASYPTYSLENFNKNYSTYANDAAAPLLNRATMGLYPPGSTLKPLTAITALQEGVTTTSEKLNDTGQWIYPGTDMGPHCWKRSGHGRLNVTGAITNSCNYFFAEMGYRLGMDKLRDYLQAFGLGEHTGIETGDAVGSLPENPKGEDQAPWAAFGQSNQLYTPLQMANYIATLAGGGDHYPAHLLKSVRSADASTILYSSDTVEPLNTVDIDPQNLKAVLQGMHNLTTQGSLSGYFKDCVVEAGAKTGTAQLGGNKKNNGVFVAFAPYDDPQIAVAIVIEKGDKGAALATTAVGILNAYFTKDEIATAIIGENQLTD